MTMCLNQKKKGKNKCTPSVVQKNYTVYPKAWRWMLLI